MRFPTLIMAFGLLFASFSWPGLAASSEKTGITGLWWTEGHDAVVSLYPCEDKICGRFHWLKDDIAEPLRDDRNPDPALRPRPLCGLAFMGGFHTEETGHYTDGWIYSPDHGATFSAGLTLLDPEKLEVYGYMILPLLGDKQVWTRTHKAPSCKTEPTPRKD